MKRGQRSVERRSNRALAATSVQEDTVLCTRTHLESEPSRTIGALEILEPVDGDTTGAGSELQQTRLLLGRPGLDCLPVIVKGVVSYDL